MTAPPPLDDDSRGPRLQKVLAAAGVGPRRACEALIESGAVTVNGQLVTSLPAWVDPANDRIAVNGRRIETSPRHVYVMLYKPRGVVTTSSDPQGRRCAVDLVRHPTRTRLFSVGRLDLDSSGLLLLTNDGELANRLAHPRYHLPKVYEVTVKGRIEAAALAKLERGLYLADPERGDATRTRGARIRVLRRDRERTRLLVELREGRNRQIRRMMLDVGHPVRKLRRVRIGPLRLRGLRTGEWRDLTPGEVAALRRATRARPDLRRDHR